MARPARNNVDYFPHPVKHGKKMSYLEKKYKNDGYAIWMKLLEELGDNDYHYLDLSNEIQIMYLEEKCNVNQDLLISVITDLVKLGEFNKELWEENNILFNEKFVDSIRDAYAKRNNKCITLDSLCTLLLSLGLLKHSKCTTKGSSNPQTKLYYTKLKKSIVKKGTEEKDFIDKIIDVFSQKFLELRDLEYISNGKDRSAAGKLLKLYKNKGSTSEETLNDFNTFFDQCLRIQDKWYWDNMSLPLINSKINEIRNLMRKDHARNSEITNAVNKYFD